MLPVDGVRHETGPGMSRVVELRVISWMKHQHEIEQHGPSDSLARVHVRVYLKTHRSNIHTRQSPRQIRHVRFWMPDQRRPLWTQSQPLVEISIPCKLRVGAYQPNPSPPE